MAFSLLQSTGTGRFCAETDQAVSKEAWAAGRALRLCSVVPSEGGVCRGSRRPRTSMGAREAMVGGRCDRGGDDGGGRFQPAPTSSSVCEFRTPDRHRLPELDQAVVPA
jgi:hypothetical protein